jgi:RNA polymerase sigma factor (sigma-70 family)
LNAALITDEQLVEQYYKLCGHISWSFVRKNDTLGTEDAEDFASAALVGLLKCPQKHRGNKFYIQVLIQNRIITAWRKRLKQLGAEQHTGDGFDELPSPREPHIDTHTAFDTAVILKLLPQLPVSERIVIELNFGLNGCPPCGEERIARKLGRTRHWAQTHLQKGLERMREQITTQPLAASVQ